MPFGNPIVGRTRLIREAIQSANYSAGVSGWSINRDGSAEFSDATLRGALQVGVSPDPRRYIGDQIPAPLVAHSADFSWDAADITYFNATEFYFEAIGIFVPNGSPIFATGSYDAVHDVIFNHFEQGPGALATPTILYGSDTYNGSAISWWWRNGSMVFTETTDVTYRGDILIDNAPQGYVECGYVTAGSVATSAGAEVAIPTLSWAREPIFSFGDNSVYRLDVQYGIGETGTTQIAPQIRLRKGSGSTAGQLLGGTAIQPVASALAFHAGTPFTAYIANQSGASIVTALSLTISGGVAANNVRLYGAVAPAPALTVTAKYLGAAIGRSGSFHPLIYLCTNIV